MFHSESRNNGWGSKAVRGVALGGRGGSEGVREHKQVGGFRKNKRRRE
jgi:hypothetical protein